MKAVSTLSIVSDHTLPEMYVIESQSTEQRKCLFLSVKKLYNFEFLIPHVPMTACDIGIEFLIQPCFLRFPNPLLPIDSFPLLEYLRYLHNQMNQSVHLRRSG